MSLNAANKYKTKAELKAAVGQTLQYEETSMYGNEFKPNGTNTMCGPDAYQSRKWYANITCRDGKIVKVL